MAELSDDHKAFLTVLAQIMRNPPSPPPPDLDAIARKLERERLARMGQERGNA